MAPKPDRLENLRAALIPRDPLALKRKVASSMYSPAKVADLERRHAARSGR